MLKIAVILALLFGIQADQCPSGYTETSPGECHLFGDSVVTSRAKAISFCKQRNGALVVINTEQELKGLENAARQLQTRMNTFMTAAIWNNGFKWMDGSVVDIPYLTSSESSSGQEAVRKNKKRTLSLKDNGAQQYELYDIELTISGLAIAALCEAK